MKFTKKQLDRYSRQIILKKVGAIGQKKLLKSSVLIVGAGGLGSPISIYLSALGVGKIGIVDNDLVNLSNIHRQSLFDMTNLNKPKVKIAKLKLKKINSKISVQEYNLRLKKNNFKKIIKKYDYIVDGSDNFETKFLINDFCKKFKKNLVVGAISKFDGHIFSYDFKNKNETCLRCFYQEDSISDDNLNCEFEGVVGTVANIVGNIQANEILKKILNIGTKLNNQILIIDLLNLNFRKIKIKKQMKCKC